MKEQKAARLSMETIVSRSLVKEGMERNRVVTGEGPALQERSLIGVWKQSGRVRQGVNHAHDREM